MSLLQAIPLVVLILISMALNGCATTTSKEALLPQDGPRMLDIYQQHYAQQRDLRRTIAINPEVTPHLVKSQEADLEGYTRNADQEIRSLFPTLPNPTLVMYVFPHLATEEGNPVPGYSTSFPMYERTEYALPGEVP